MEGYTACANRAERRIYDDYLKKCLNEIESIRDDEIDYSDIPETHEAFWEQAEMKIPKTGRGIYIYLDPDVLEWLKMEDINCQTRINEILRNYYEAHKK
ncbi:MAG: BrnA antitoxin family protein [bacterium]